jgi:UTP--glucose-1-phosphate uridylyltransferase
MKVNKKTVNRWGIYSQKYLINRNNFYIKDVIEKPNIKSAPSNNAVIGRYILPRKIFSKLNNLNKGKGGEIHITDAIRKLINEGENFVGHIFKGKYLDCGTMKGYIKSSMEISKI